MARYHNPKITTNKNLSLVLDAANPKSYTGVTTSVTDISLNNNTATLYNGVGYTSSNVGYFTFDGTNDYMEIPYDESVNLTDGDFTIDFWMNSSSDQTSDVLVSYGNTSTVGGWAIKTATNKLQYSVGFATHPALAGIVTSGLVLHLDAGDSASYPGSGTTWTDLSGNGNNGTLVNGVGYDSASGGSLTFDGVNDYVSLPNNNSIAFGSGEFTFEFWLFRNASSQSSILDTRALGQNPSGQISVFINSNGEIEVIEVGVTRLSGGSTTINSWNHYALVRDSSNVVTGYINGVSVDTWSTSLNFTLGSAPRIGSTVNNTFYLNGLISNTRIYKGKGLTPSEIQRNYNALKGRYTSPSPLDPLDTFGITENADFSSGITTNTWNHYALVRSGNVYTPYVNAVPGTSSYVYGVDSNMDLYFDNASIILNANGDDGSTNIIDSSKNNHTGIITAYNGAGISTSEYKFGGSSLYFDGTNDYIDCGISSDYSFGNGPFTIEFWMRVNTSFFHAGSQKTIFNTTRDYGQFNQFIYGGIELEARIGYGFNDPNIGQPFASFYFTQRDNSGSNGTGFSVPDYVSRGAFFHDNWGHIAISCDGTYHRLFFNGVLAPSLMTAYKQPYEGDQIIIGGRKLYGSISNFINAYIDDFRITKGVAKYTEDFIPPNQASYYSNDPNYDNLSILLQGNGQNLSTSIIDSSPYNHTGIITAYNGAGISTSEYKFGGSSLYFDGTDDYIDCGTDSSYAMGDEDFTIEFWMYTENQSLGQSEGFLFHIGPRSESGNNNVPDGGLSAYVENFDGIPYLYFTIKNGSSSYIRGGGRVPNGQWNHISIVRSGSTGYTFINGTNLFSFSIVGNPYNENDLTLGVQYMISSGTRYYYRHFNGYIDDFRITKGVAKYTDDFVPPDRTKIKNNQASLKFGASGIGNTNPFNGALSNLKIYKDSLTQSEITQNFNAHKSRYGL